MKELRIKKFTAEEFKNKFNLDNIENISAYEISELGNLFENSSEEVYFLIEDKLYAEPKETIGEGELSREDIETIEKLNEEFRDSLISLREFLYHGNGKLDSEEARTIQVAMNNNIKSAKEILNRYNIIDKDQLKKMSKKYFMPDFLNGVFGNEEYNFENEVEIDCGL
ncbi:hypothetical protein QTH16_08745 [Clostridium perfringens]|uniref:hypothetical protein n=1 Tax=Clostridium perfringens TaxID=1502 RepID=UPI0024BCB7D6|nr:hypothetical protein [Clostridium perfringens]MDK0538170.1 hypothetical protein [Clostridium perfringens]MDK0979711.1 hypothetical protein [Clostridium perfringens]MDM0454735.1 hypothetical protein [Clostridium perfringens]